jgi:hypothetical protein
MPVTIRRAQRDAIYEMVINHLSGIGDVWLAVHRRDFADAKRLGRKFGEDMRLLEDLGWAETIDCVAAALRPQPPRCQSVPDSVDPRSSLEALRGSLRPHESSPPRLWMLRLPGLDLGDALLARALRSPSG